MTGITPTTHKPHISPSFPDIPFFFLYLDPNNYKLEEIKIISDKMKRTYDKPILKLHGKLEDLTKKTGPAVDAENAFNPS